MVIAKHVLPAILFALVLTTVGETTDVRIRFLSPDDGKVVIQRAELLLAGWGWNERVTLPVQDGNSIAVVFDSPEAMEQILTKFPNLETVRILIDAPGFVLTVSEPFRWLGPERETDTRVNFGSGRAVSLGLGQDRALDVVLRRPGTRVVRFVDQNGLGVPSLNVRASMFLSHLNHCGFPAGEVLRTAMTDDNGRLEVPDGDFRYAFELEWGKYDFVQPRSGDAIRPVRYATTYLSDTETVVRLRRFNAIRLSLSVSVNDRPVAGAVFTDETECGSCGACSGPLGQTDYDGRLTLEDFYPEKRDSICLTDDRGALLWQARSETLTSEPIAIRLPAGVTPATQASRCPPP